MRVVTPTPYNTYTNSWWWEAIRNNLSCWLDWLCFFRGRLTRSAYGFHWIFCLSRVELYPYFIHGYKSTRLFLNKSKISAKVRSRKRFSLNWSNGGLTCRTIFSYTTHCIEYELHIHTISLWFPQCSAL